MSSQVHQFDVEDTPSQHSSNRRLAFIDHIPTLKEYIRDTWLDFVVVICVGALAFGLNLANSASTRQFPVIFPRGGGVVYPTFAYPRRRSIIPIWLDILLVILIPTLFFVITQIRVRSVYDLNTAFWGLIWAISSATLFQVVIKTLIGGFRPHFLSVCNPDLSRIQGIGAGFQTIMFDISICSPDANKSHLRDAVKSFPSGHTAAAASGFIYLSLYFNSKMKIFSNERPHFYKLLVFLAPLLGATLIGGALTVDNSHHWYDVLAGAIIGALGAFAAFRMSYASIWDYRFNHIPLPRPGPSWSPFNEQTHGRYANSSTAPTTAQSKALPTNYFTYHTGVCIFPSFAHQRGWCPAGAPGDAWSGNELGQADTEFQHQAVPGFFVQSDPPTGPKLQRRLPVFGLKEYTSPTYWKDFKTRIVELQQPAPQGTRYIVCWLARHGQAWHNVFSTTNTCRPDTSDDQGFDPQLTPLGETQANAMNMLWKAELARPEDPAPAPTKWFSSPLARTLATMDLTFKNIFPAAESTAHAPLVIENLREVLSPFPHDKRRSKAEIQRTYPAFQIENSFTEEDELWGDSTSESDAQLNARVRSTLDDIVENYLDNADTYISITTHSGVILMILRIIGHRIYPLPPGGVIPLVIKVSEQH